MYILYFVQHLQDPTSPDIMSLPANPVGHCLSDLFLGLRLVTLSSLVLQPLSYEELLQCHNSITDLAPEMGYRRAAAFLYSARLSQLRAKQAALHSFTAAQERLTNVSRQLEEEIADLEH